MMPVMNGWEFLAARHDDVMLATIPVVVVSAAYDAARAEGAAGYIKKPVDLERLIAVVERYCGLPASKGVDQAS
jgi:CheY-like chemotaxis protein